MCDTCMIRVIFVLDSGVRTRSGTGHPYLDSRGCYIQRGMGTEVRKARMVVVGAIGRAHAEWRLDTNQVGAGLL